MIRFSVAGLLAVCAAASACCSRAADSVAVFSPRDPHRSLVDIPVDLDLSEARGVTFDFRCEDLSPFRGLTVHLKSGDGWYRCGYFEPRRSSETQRIEIPVVGCGHEGRVRSLRKVTTLRLSLWRGLTNSVRYSVSGIAPCGRRDGTIVLVRGDWLEKRGDETFKMQVRRQAQKAGKILEAAGFAVVTVADKAIDDEALRNVAAVVLPHNPRLPDAASAALDRYVEGGGAVVRGVQDLEKTLLAKRPGLAAGLTERKSAVADRRRSAAEWIASRPGKAGERRAFWCHSPYGLTDCTWEASVEKMRALGFNVLFANVCWAGTAHYASAVLPVSADVKKQGDALEACLSACRNRGVECHAWKVCWNVGRRATEEFRRQLANAGRLQVDFAGSQNATWMCPNHPLNRELEIASLVEVAKKGVAGIHLDYIRYPSKDYCFCPSCRKAFERTIGHAVARWPQDVRSDKALAAAWKEFRTETISSVVRDMARRVHAESPGVRISAAVTADCEQAVVERGQDWVGWCRKGWVDVACPMDYTESPLDFAGRIAQQRELVGAEHLMPGIGLTCWKDPELDALILSHHVESVRAAGLNGYVVFALAPRAIKSMTPLRTAVLSD